jgi:hypothetical protein
MLGFLFGTLCLIGLIRAIRGPCAWHGVGWHGRFHRGDRGWRFGGPPGPGPRMGLYWLSDRLQATPGQERVILAAADRLAEAHRKVAEAVRRAATTSAREIRGERLDRAALEQQLQAAHAEFVHIEEALLESAAEIHEALEPDQRRALADLLERAAGAPPWGLGFGPRPGCA